MDNGANVHMFADRWMFSDYRTFSEPSHVTAAGGHKLLILGEGN